MKQWLFCHSNIFDFIFMKLLITSELYQLQSIKHEENNFGFWTTWHILLTIQPPPHSSFLYLACLSLLFHSRLFAFIRAKVGGGPSTKQSFMKVKSLKGLSIHTWYTYNKLKLILLVKYGSCSYCPRMKLWRYFRKIPWSLMSYLLECSCKF